jgi:hypothetical protein
MFDAWSQNDSELGLAFQAFELGIQIKDQIIHAFKRNLNVMKIFVKKNLRTSKLHLPSKSGLCAFWFMEFCYLSIKEVVCKFWLSCWDLPNPSAPCRVLGTIGKPLMSRGVMGVC